MNLAKAYKSGQVRRYHQHPVLSRLGQTNADHQWGVTMLIMLLHPNPSPRLISNAMTHDVGEIDAGDISGPFKREHPEHYRKHEMIERESRNNTLGEKTPKFMEATERDWLHFADRLESCLYVMINNPPIAASQAWEEQLDECAVMARDLDCFPEFTDLITGMRK